MGRLGLAQCDVLAMHVKTMRSFASMLKATASTPTDRRRATIVREDVGFEPEAAHSAHPAEIHRRPWWAEQCRMDPTSVSLYPSSPSCLTPLYMADNDEELPVGAL